MYLADEPLYDWTKQGNNTVGGTTTTGVNVKDIKLPSDFMRNTLAKQNKLSNISLLEGRGLDLNVQTFIKNQNKLAPILPDYKEEPIITDVKELPEEKNTDNNNTNTIYGLPKMVVYGGGAVLTLAILYFILKD
jgi:hypothetical protein